MRIYLQYKNVGTEYITYAPISISLTPFNKYCYYIDLLDKPIKNLVHEEGDSINRLLIPYNIKIREYCFQNKETGEITDEDNIEDYDNYLEGDLVKTYKEGILVSSVFKEC